MAGDHARLQVWVRGHVQGVGFRYWVRAQACELGLAGWAANLADGRVEIVAEGTRSACARLLAALHSARPPGRVDEVETSWADPSGEPPGFRVR